MNLGGSFFAGINERKKGKNFYADIIKKIRLYAIIITSMIYLHITVWRILHSLTLSVVIISQTGRGVNGCVQKIFVGKKIIGGKRQ